MARAPQPESAFSTAPTSGSVVPLYVDLDGTLVATDLLWEGVVLLLRSNPGQIWGLIAALTRGRAALKAEVARLAVPDPKTLPYRAGTLALVREAQAAGRPVILATAAAEPHARAIAEYVGGFSAVLSSNAERNLTGRTKLAAIQEHAQGPFDYAGDESRDQPIMAAARTSYLVAPNGRVPHKRAGQKPPIIIPRPSRWRSFARALRPHQWSKNLLVFAPALLAHRILDPETLLRCVVAFASFSLAASGTYLLNDFLDISADRIHPTKRRRPFASGDLPLAAGVVGGPLLLLIGLAGAIPLGRGFVLLLLTYVAMSQAYTLTLKQQPVLDVLTLSALYSVRIFAGAVAAGVAVSAWLLAFSSFLFLSLAFAKRYEELLELKGEGPREVMGRGYEAGDTQLVLALGPASGYLAVLVFALYTYSDAVRALYLRPGMLWLEAPLLLYWVTRLWFLTHRGKLGADPVIFAVRDPVSYVIAVLAALVIGAAGPL